MFFEDNIKLIQLIVRKYHENPIIDWQQINKTKKNNKKEK